MIAPENLSWIHQLRYNDLFFLYISYIIKNYIHFVLKVLAALRFFGGGSYQLDIGSNKYFCISQPSVSRSIHAVIDSFNASNLFNDCVKFPQTVGELNVIRESFYSKYGFPGVIGAIDCTHIAIFPPKKEIEYVYVNRKGYHSINTQLICNSNLKIISANARYPGSTHDSFIWNNCNVLPIVQELHQLYPNQYYLLGDSGYALRPWMYTPMEAAQNDSPEGNYNKAQMSARSLIEQVNGVLKMRFRCCLKHRTLHYAPETAANIINICCALHNLCIDNNLENVPPQLNDDLLDGIFPPIHEENNPENVFRENRRILPTLADARMFQQRLIQNYFTF